MDSSKYLPEDALMNGLNFDGDDTPDTIVEVSTDLSGTETETDLDTDLTATDDTLMNTVWENMSNEGVVIEIDPSLVTEAENQHSRLNDPKFVEEETNRICRIFGLESANTDFTIEPEYQYSGDRICNELFHSIYGAYNQAENEAALCYFQDNQMAIPGLGGEQLITPFRVMKTSPTGYTLAIFPYIESSFFKQQYLLPIMQMLVSLESTHTLDIYVGGGCTDSMSKTSGLIGNLIGLCKADTTIHIDGALSICDFIALICAKKKIELGANSIVGFDTYPYAILKNEYAVAKQCVHRELLSHCMSPELIEQLFNNHTVIIQPNELKDIVGRHNSSLN